MEKFRLEESPKNIRDFEQIFYDKSNVKNSKWCRRIFYYIWEKGKSRPKDFLNNLQDKDTGYITQPVLHRCLRLMIFEKIIEKLDTKGRGTYYDLVPKYKSKEFNQLIYFNKIREQEEKENLTFSDRGVPGFFRHTIYGLPDLEKMTDYESRIALGLLMQINDAFYGLRKLKLVYELRKKVDEGWLSNHSFPHGIVSEKLSLQLLIAHFSHRLYGFLEGEPNKKKSFQFLLKLMDEVCRLGREMKFDICDKGSPYPEKEFCVPNNFMFDYLFMCNPELPSLFEELFNNRFDYKPFIFLKNKTWFFDKKNFITIEKLENRSNPYEEYNDCFHDSPIVKDYEKKTKKKFYDKDIPINESITLLSTHSIEYSQDIEMNVELKLDWFFKNNKIFDGKKLKKSQIWRIINKSEYLIHEVISCKRMWNKDSLSRYQFLHNKHLNEIYNHEIIEFLLNVIDFISNTLNIYEFSEIGQALIYKGFEKNGLWYNENEGKEFYNQAKNLYDKIDVDEFSRMIGKRERFDRIQQLIDEDNQIPFYLKNNINGCYGIHNLICYIEAKLYFEKLRSIIKKRADDFFKNQNGKDVDAIEW